MTTCTTKQVWQVALLAVALLGGLDASVTSSRAVQCREKNDTCSTGRECCGEMVCADGECSLLDEPEDCEFSLQGAFFVNTDYEDASGKWWGFKCTAPGSCVNINTTSDEGEELGVSSINWSEDTGLQLFDAEGCGGDSLVVFTAGKYDAVIDSKNNTRRRGFLAGGIPDLASVCKYQRCGTLDESVDHIKFEKCVCEETWNNSVLSYRILDREIDTLIVKSK